MEQPTIIINVAQSLDGYISGHTGKRIQISCNEDMKRVANLRRQCDGVMVGKNTALFDKRTHSGDDNNSCKNCKSKCSDSSSFSYREQL